MPEIDSHDRQGLSRRGMVSGSIALALAGSALSPTSSAQAAGNPFDQLWNPWGNATDLNLTHSWADHDYRGLDYNLSWKTPVRAPHSGIVTTRNTTACGNELRITHSSGYTSTFFHLYDYYQLPSYSTPGWVNIGDYVALSGGRKWADAAKTTYVPEWPSRSGTASNGPHLHWHLETSINGARTDPRPWINFSGPGGVPIPPLLGGDDMPTRYSTDRSVPIALSTMTWAQQDSQAEWPLPLAYTNTTPTNLAELPEGVGKQVFSVTSYFYVSNLPAGEFVHVRLGVQTAVGSAGPISGMGSMTFEGNSTGRARGNYSANAPFGSGKRLVMQAYASVAGVSLDSWGTDILCW